jgi:hypothetical protein
VSCFSVGFVWFGFWFLSLERERERERGKQKKRRKGSRVAEWVVAGWHAKMKERNSHFLLFYFIFFDKITFCFFLLHSGLVNHFLFSFFSIFIIKNF